METDFVQASVRTDATVSREVVDVLDEIRWEQVELVEYIRAASTRVSGSSVRVGFAMAGHARLTQQFFDAQRAILMRLATFDAQAGEECQRVSDPFVERSSADLVAAQRDLANLLDDWWASVNRHGESMMARTPATGTRQLPPPMPLATAGSVPEALTPGWPAPVAPSTGSAAIAAPVMLRAPLAFDAPLGGRGPTPPPAAPLPADVVYALDHADVDHLEVVLASIAGALRNSSTDRSPAQSDFGPTEDDDPIVCLRPFTDDEALAGLAMHEHRQTASLGDNAGRDLIKRTLLPMIAASTALTAVMALLG